ncbi:sensor histidine kinase [Auritidibacter sp. NML100628]|uniref:sensor histidine kinase n=1 Tax=Auritidibacter sp. NML100628 TaxID=2170742 RepID=UPI000D736477|nr:hypothetical protein [Auritidibacter sp. NML100628]PXA77069.1 hypothetical protein DCC24_05615 [Auritidibacter sp. NML100628]
MTQPTGAWAETSSLKRLTRYLRGPRYIDLPFRVLLLIIAVAGVTPDSLETNDPSYLAFQILAAVLVVGVCFIPATAGFLGFAAFAVFAIVFPYLVNPFQTVGEAAVAFVLSQLRIRLFLLFTLLLFGIALIPASLGLWSGKEESIITLAFGWALAVVLGLVAAGIEGRIRKEIARREQLARAHQRKLERMRLDMALDTHDTVSHGLAAEAAIVRTLGIAARMEGRSDSKLTELALVNAHTQQQLRVLLARLTDDPDGYSATGPFEDEMLRATEMIRSATEAGGFDITIDIGQLPEDVPGEVLEASLFTLKELATNIVKHSSETTNCAITIDSHRDSPDAWVMFEAVNPSPVPPDRAPRSLSARIERVGGSLSILHDEGLVNVRTSIPIREQDPM